MSLSDKLKSAQNEILNQSCVLGKLLSGTELSASDKQNLSNILNIPLDSPTRIPNAELGRILREEGYDISNSSIDRHRRGDCRCRESK